MQRDRPRAGFLFAVPELTRGADIKLNSGVLLQPRLHRIVITHRTISPSVRAHTRQSCQAIILRLAALLPALGGCSSMIERWLPSRGCRFDSATRSRVTALCNISGETVFIAYGPAKNPAFPPSRPAFPKNVGSDFSAR